MKVLQVSITAKLLEESLRIKDLAKKYKKRTRKKEYIAEAFRRCSSK